MSQQFWQWWNWVWSDAGGTWAGVIVTIFGFSFAVASLRALIRQNSIAENALADARKAFLLTNRPHLKVRRVMAVRDPDGGSEDIAASVEFINIGNTDARVYDTRGAIQLCEHRVAVTDDDWREMEKGPELVLRPGQTATFVFETGELSVEDFIRFRDMARITFAVGRIRYLDDVGITRELGFCRAFNHRTRRYVYVDDPDFEYED